MLYQLSYLAATGCPNKKPPGSGGGDNSGGGIRTRDLRVMSPTSYQAAPPRDKDTEFNRAGSIRQPLRRSGSAPRNRPATRIHRGERTQISGSSVLSSP